MSHLVPCLSCQRHVAVAEDRCPFCGVARSAGQRASAPPEMPRRRLGRAALFTFGATLIGGAACSDDAGKGADAGRDTPAADSSSGTTGTGGAASGGRGGSASGGVTGSGGSGSGGATGSGGTSTGGRGGSGSGGTTGSGGSGGGGATGSGGTSTGGRGGSGTGGGVAPAYGISPLYGAPSNDQ